MPWCERWANHVREPDRNHPTGTNKSDWRFLIGREEEDLPQGGVAGQEAGGAPELFDVREEVSRIFLMWEEQLKIINLTRKIEGFRIWIIKII